MELLDEARILLENKSYARAVALAIMSYEELGKSQIAADYYSGILPESEYKKAFKQHKKTAYANRYFAIGSHEKVQHAEWLNERIGSKALFK